jgi:hypothetical protein
MLSYKKTKILMNYANGISYDSAFFKKLLNVRIGVISNHLKELEERNQIIVKREYKNNSLIKLSITKIKKDLNFESDMTLKEWLVKAEKGDKIIYHKGYLPFDKEDRNIVRNANEALHFFKCKKISITQRKIVNFCYEYIAKKL